MDISLGSDGTCTGLSWLGVIFSWLKPLLIDFNACCVVHDAGGTDGQLLDCWQLALVNHDLQWAWPLACYMVTYMCLFRPVYNSGQRLGWWK